MPPTPLGLRVATPETNGSAAVLPRPKALPPIPGSTKTPKKAKKAKKYAVTPLDDSKPAPPAGGGRDRTHCLLKCTAVWLVVLTLCWTAGFVLLWYREADPELRQELALLQEEMASLALQANASSTEAAALRVQLQQSQAAVAELSQRNETALREDMRGELDGVRAELLLLIDQRRRANERRCGSGEFATGVDGQPCAPCPADTFSADGTVCVACPAGMHPDAFAARCTMDADDVYAPPVLHSWLAFTFDVADLAWFSNADVRDGIMMAIAASLQMEREELVNEAMEVSTGQVVFELIDSPNRTVSEYREAVASGLWNAFFIDPIINVTECGRAVSEHHTSCVRTERIQANAVVGGVITADDYIAAVAASTGLPPSQVAVTSYLQQVDGSIQVPGLEAEIQPGLSSTAGPRAQITTALAGVVRVDPAGVVITEAEQWARGVDLPQGRRRRRLQTTAAGFFTVVRVAYRVSSGEEISARFANSTFEADLLEEINRQGDAYVRLPGNAPRIGTLSTVDLVVGQPEYQAIVEFEVVASGGTASGMVEASLSSSSFVSLLNSSGLVTGWSGANVTGRRIVSDPIPPPPPPPLVNIDSDSVRATNVTTTRLKTGTLHADSAAVSGNSTFASDVVVGGRVVAGSAEISSRISVAGGAVFGGMVDLNDSLRVAGAAHLEDQLAVDGSLSTAGDSVLAGSVTLGASRAHAVAIGASIASPSLCFDADGSAAQPDGVGSMTLEWPDPARNHVIRFPEETGEILTTASNITRLATVTSGTLAPGFGAVDTSALAVHGPSVLEGAINLTGTVRTRSLRFDADENGIAMEIRVPDPSLQGGDVTITEACIAVDAAACSQAQLNGVAASCTGVGACTYTPEVIGVPDSCEAQPQEVDLCSSANITLNSSFTECDDAMKELGNCTRPSDADAVWEEEARAEDRCSKAGNCTYIARNYSLQSSAQCVPWSSPICAAVDISSGWAYGRKLSCERAANCVYTAVVEAVSEACEATDLVACQDVDLSGDTATDNATCHAAGQCAYTPAPANMAISFPIESGEVLTTASENSVLRSVGSLIRGSLGDGFGPANVESLRSRGPATFSGDVHVGSNSSDKVSIVGTVTSAMILHDSNQDGVGMSLHYTDPPTATHISFPAASGVLLTDTSSNSALTTVSGLTSGSLEPGFGNASIAALHSTGDARLDGDIRLGSSTSSKLELSGVIQNDEMVFAAGQCANGTGSCGGNLTISIPVLTDTDHRIDLPAESGMILTSASRSSTLTAVATLNSGSLGPSFGSASVASLESRGNSALNGSVSIGTGSGEDTLTIGAVVASDMLTFGRDANHPLMTVHMPQYDESCSLTLPNENGTVLTSVSEHSALRSVGQLGDGAITMGFGDIEFGSNLKMANSSAVLELQGTLTAMSNVRLGTTSSDMITVGGTFSVVDQGGTAAFSVEPQSGRASVSGDLVLGGSLITGSQFGSSAFNVSSIDEFAEGVGVTVEGVTFREGSIVGALQAEAINEVAGREKGVSVDGVLIKDGRIFTNSLCLYGKKEADPCESVHMVLCPDIGACMPRATCESYYDVSGDGCFMFDAGQDVISISANTVTSDKIMDRTIQNADIADQAVTTRNTDFTSLVLEDAGPVGRLTPNDWLYADRCIGPDGFVIEELHTEVLCRETTVPTGHAWRGAACIDSSGGPSVVRPELTEEVACESVTASTGHVWDVDICVDQADLSVATFVAVDEGYTCTDMWAGPGVRATHIVSGVCVEADGVTIRTDLSTQAECTLLAVATGHEWQDGSMCVDSELNVVAAASETACTIMDALTDNTWHTGWICVADTGEAILNATWLGGCEGTQALTMLTLSNTGRTPEGVTEISGNTESTVRWRHQYQGTVSPIDTGIIGVGTEGHAPATGTYMQFSTSGGGEMQKRMRLFANGDATIYGGVLRVQGDMQTGMSKLQARTSLGDDDSDITTISGYLAQPSLMVDSDGDGESRLSLTFPSLASSQEIAFPAESGTVLTTSSKHSTLQAVANVSSGSLEPGFGSAHVASLVSEAGTSLRGSTSLGNDAEDSLALTGFITTRSLVFDTDWDGQCLTLEFPDPTSMANYRPGDYVFEQDMDITSPTYGSFLPGDAKPAEGTPGGGAGALVFVNDTVTFRWLRFDNLHLSAFFENPEAPCPSDLSTAMTGGFDTGTLASPGEYSMTFSSEADVGVYCLGGTNFDETMFALRVRLNPSFGYARVDISVRDGGAIGQLSWELRDAEGNVVLSAVGQSTRDTLNGHASVLPDGSNYTFSITDRGDDGIQGDGGYEVYLDGVLVVAETSQFSGPGLLTWAGGFKGTASHVLTMPSRALSPSVFRDETGRPGYPIGAYQPTHCGGNISHTVTFPSEDGTLLVKHQGETRLGGEVFLGGDAQDSVFVPGRLNGTITFAEEAVVMGTAPLRFGGALFGTLNETVGEWCRDDDAWAATATSGAQANCSELVDFLSAGGLDCATNLGSGLPSDYCKESCGLCINHTDPIVRTGFTTTLQVTEPTMDLAVTLPGESGTLLTDNSVTSRLQEVGNLSRLTVAGQSQLVGDATLGTTFSDGSTPRLIVESTVHGADAIRFDAGVEPATGAHLNVCAGGTCTAQGESGSALYPASLAIDGVAGGGSGGANRWLSSDTTPYHWFAVHLGKPHFISRFTAMASRTASELGLICRHSVQYLPFSSGEYRTLAEVTDAMEAGITSPTQWETHQTSGGWVTLSEEFTAADTIDISFATVTTEVVRLNMDMSWSCEPSLLGSIALFEVAVFGLPERAYTTLAVAAPTFDRTVTLPDESGTLLTDASSLPGVFGVGVVLAGDRVTLPSGVALVRVERNVGGNDALFTWPAGREGQMLVVVNEDDNPLTEDFAVYGIGPADARVIDAGANGLFFFVAGSWVTVGM